MGCFSSKHVARSRSLRDDLSSSLQRRTVGIPGLEDLFAASKSSTATVAGPAAPDDFLALLCTANTVAMKLKEREEKLMRMSQQQEDEEEQGGLTSYESGTDDPAAVVNARGLEDEEHDTAEENKDENGKELVVFDETINAWELMAGLEDYSDDQTADTNRPHVRGELESGSARGFVVSMGRPAKEEENVGARNEEGSSLSCVEENRSSSTGSSIEEDTPVDKQVISSTKIGVDAAQPAKCPDDLLVKNAQLDNIPPTNNIPTESLKTIAGAKPAQVHSTPNPRPPEPPGAAALKALAYSDSFRFTRTNAVLPTEEDDTGKGVRRKARAKELKPLNVPAFEFEDIQNWLQGNDHQLYDSDPYETPKFGNYLKSIAKARKEASGEMGPLDPDLVASLQDTIDGMTAEEERILKQFVEEFLEIHGSGGSN